jgi:uncharacterized membrane protein YadS
MFIIMFLLIVIAQANGAIIPHWIMVLVSSLAILETLFYLAVIGLQISIWRLKK